MAIYFKGRKDYTFNKYNGFLVPLSLKLECGWDYLRDLLLLVLSVNLG